MRSLFAQVFIWFWGCMAVATLTMMLITVTTEPSIALRQQMVSAALQSYGQSAVLAYEKGGRAHLAEYLQGIGNNTGFRPLLLDHSGGILGGFQPRTEAARERLHRVAKHCIFTGKPQFDTGGPFAVGAELVSGNGFAGRPFVFIGLLPGTMRPSESMGLFGPVEHSDEVSRWIRLLAMLVTTGLVCYGLARHLSGPIVRLQEAAKELASGNLKARVGPAVGRRRDEIADLARDFDRMADRIEAIVLAQKRLLGDISHELRSPLARLGVALELARRYSPPEADRALDRIERESIRINELIGQLLVLTRLESGEEGQQHQTINLRKLVQEVAADAEFEAQSKNRAVRVLSTSACTMKGDPDLIRSAVENVVRNALVYTPAGSSVDVKLKRSAQPDGTAIAVLTIRDFGPGVPEESLEKLFRPFYRVGDARDRQSGGIGLGLTITDRAVSTHHGTVQATNDPGGGLCVTIRLPVE